MENLVVDDSIQQQFIIAKEMITLAIEGFIQKDEKQQIKLLKWMIKRMHNMKRLKRFMLIY